MNRTEAAVARAKLATMWGLWITTAALAVGVGLSAIALCLSDD